MKELLSQRGQANVKDMPMLVHAHWRTVDDAFDATKNPEGYINLGTAENRLIDSRVLEMLGDLQRDIKLEEKHIHYELFHGSKDFRQAIAAYWQEVLLGKNSARKLSAENIVVSCGCSLALEMLAYALCDPGEVVLIASPFYPGFVHDIESRAEVVPVGVQCGMELSKKAFEQALDEQRKKGKKVRAVLFSSPNNPTGHVYSADAIKGLIKFCMENDLDIMADEIYAQTIHDPAADWVSALKLVPEEYKHRVHVSGGFAKDFALSGFRVGFLHSYNPYVVQASQEASYFASVSTHTQALLTDMLKSDHLPDLLKKSKSSIHTAYLKIKNMLEEVGIKVQDAQGGIFVFADFRPFLKNATYEAEMELWKHIFDDLKVNISPGRLFDAPEPGYFRLCFAHAPEYMDQVGKRFAKLSPT